MANEQSESGLNYAIGIDATILETQVAGLIKGGAKTQVLVLPKNAETAEKLSFRDLLDGVAKQFNLPKEKIESTIKSITSIFPEFEPEKLTFQLNQIFFYYEKEAGEGKTATIEYAFSIKINLGEFLNLAGVISIKTLYMAIWNTARQSVLKQFDMADISALLPK